MIISREIIITFTFITLLLLTSCGTRSDNASPKGPQKEPDFISDQYGFKIFDLGGYEVDNEGPVLARNVLSLKKADVKVRLGYLKGVKIKAEITGFQNTPEKQLLYEWVMNSIQIPMFYPDTTKVLLKWEYEKVAKRDAITTDILLERNEKDEITNEKPGEKRLIKLRESDKAMFEAHKRILLKSYTFYRGDDLFNIEFLADPLTYHTEIDNFENSIIKSMVLMEKGN